MPEIIFDTHQNVELTKRLSEVFKMRQTDIRNAVSHLLNSVVVANDSRFYPITTYHQTLSGSTTGTVVTGVTGKRFIITGVSYSAVKNATSVNTAFSVLYTQGGQSKTLIKSNYLASTATRETVTHTFEPIVCDEGTSITLLTTAAEGANDDYSCTITGYFENIF